VPQLRDATTVDDPRLDRLVEFDEASREYPVGAVLGRVGAPQQPVTKLWPVGLWLNQGQEGACEGFGFGHELAAGPVPVAGLTDRFARETIYWGTQKIDPWPGGAYPGAIPSYEGTSVLSGAKFMTNTLHAYTGYHWAFSLNEVALAISYLGPVVLGIPWYAGMYKPNSSGVIRPTGSLVGGHCILAVGYDATAVTFRLHNSWGRSWGQDGAATIAGKDLDNLLHQQGEACIPDGRQLITV
jgi:hypothetical protein